MGLATVLLTAHTVILVVGSLLLLYPVVSYAWNVAYKTEILLLSASFLALAAAYATGFFLEFEIVSSVFDLVSALCAFLAMWRLANRFTEPDEDDELAIGDVEHVEGGFRGGETDEHAG